ncbi:MAG TPA: hypothetical protein VFD59_12015 [Nocardioidaceae bacterium]|nr:hypothetical protein [Nocardioidaceae bacterium]
MSERELQTGPDGRFAWNGQGWVPIPDQQPRTALLVVAIIGGALGSIVFLSFLLLLVVLGPAIFAIARAFG